MQRMYFACMKNIQIRKVPDQVCDVLRRRAAEEGMSLQEYLLSAVRELASRPSVSEVLKRAGSRAAGELRLSVAAKHLRAERDAR